MFERLRAWRTSVAKELGMPPYVIFHDATLRLIAASPPSTLDELRQVNGVGAPSWTSTARRSSTSSRTCPDRMGLPRSVPADEARTLAYRPRTQSPQ